MKKRKKVILFAPGHIGDFIWFTSVLSMIQFHKTDAEFILFTSKIGKQFINKNFNVKIGLIKENLFYHRNRFIRYIYKFFFVFDVFKIIKYFKTDTIILFSTPPGFFIPTFSKLYRIKNIIYGNYVYSGSTINKIFLKYCSKIIDFSNINNMHIMLKLQQVYRAYFNDYNLSVPILPDTDYLSAKINSLIGNTREYRIGICSRGSVDWKFLDIQFLKDLIEKIDVNYNSTFFVFGSGNKNNNDSIKLQQLLPHIDIRDMYNKTTLLELIEFMKNIDVLISIDTGVVHIAATVNTPVISLCGPTLPTVSAPISHNGITLYSGQKCSPCDAKINSNSLVCNDMKCLKNISSEDVFKEVKKILNKKYG